MSEGFLDGFFTSNFDRYDLYLPHGIFHIHGSHVDGGQARNTCTGSFCQKVILYAWVTQMDVYMLVYYIQYMDSYNVYVGEKSAK